MKLAFFVLWRIVYRIVSPSSPLSSSEPSWNSVNWRSACPNRCHSNPKMLEHKVSIFKVGSESKTEVVLWQSQVELWSGALMGVTKPLGQMTAPFQQTIASKERGRSVRVASRKLKGNLQSQSSQRFQARNLTSRGCQDRRCFHFN